MTQRLLYLALTMFMLVIAMAYTGWSAGELVNLEKANMTSWQKKMATLSQQRADTMAQWLQNQLNVANDLSSDPRIVDTLNRRADGSERGLPAPQAERAVFEFGTLTHAINHIYVFNKNGELVTQGEKSRDLPLRIREQLGHIYSTELPHYITLMTLSNNPIMLVSKRVKSRQGSVGYVAYIQEASVALDTLPSIGADHQDMDYILARRSGENNVYLSLVDNGNARVTQTSLESISLPIFDGATPLFRVEDGLDGTPSLIHVEAINGFPFWQLVGLVPASVARDDLTTKRYSTLALSGVVLLLLLGLIILLARRIIWPDINFFPFKKGFERFVANHTTTGKPTKDAQPKAVSPQTTNKSRLAAKTSNLKVKLARAAGVSELADFKNSADEQTEGSNQPKGLLSKAKNILGKAVARTLTDEEKAALKEIKQAPATPEATPAATKPTPTEPEEAPLADEEEGEVADSFTQPEEAPKEPETIYTPLAEAEGQMLHPQSVENIKKILEADQEEQQKVKEILRCLDDERLRLFFQPIQNLKTGENVMFETFVRLVQDSGDLMMPGDFFPLANKHGFVGKIDDSVIAASLRRHMEILTQGKKATLSINLSYGAFSSRQFMETFELGLASGRIKPQFINFEVSSKELIEDPEGMRFINDMREKGCKFSVDFLGDIRVIAAAKRMKFDYIKADCLRFEGLGDGD